MSAARSQSGSLNKQRNFILVTLLVLAAIAWVLILRQWDTMDDDRMSMNAGQMGDMTNAAAGTGEPSSMSGAGDTANTSGGAMEGMPAAARTDVEPATDMGTDDDEMAMGLTMDMTAPLYLGIWAAMMVAIMFPTAAPMILAFAKVQGARRQQGQLFVPTWLFVGSYITLWSATGFLAYAAAAGGDELARNWSWLMDNAARIGGVVLILAGLYQLTPLKKLCLAKCRTPMAFLLGSWRDGNAGAVRMGLEHGAYCLGCCWMLFVILFPLGMMNVAAMALITAVIFAEKATAIGPRVAQVAAAALVVYGAIVIAIPDALPTTI